MEKLAILGEGDADVANTVVYCLHQLRRRGKDIIHGDNDIAAVHPRAGIRLVPRLAPKAAGPHPNMQGNRATLLPQHGTPTPHMLRPLSLLRRCFLRRHSTRSKPITCSDPAIYCPNAMARSLQHAQSPRTFADEVAEVLVHNVCHVVLQVVGTGQFCLLLGVWWWVDAECAAVMSADSVLAQSGMGLFAASAKSRAGSPKADSTLGAHVGQKLLRRWRTTIGT